MGHGMHIYGCASRQMKSYEYTTDYTIGELSSHNTIKPFLLSLINIADSVPLKATDEYYSDDIHRVDWNNNNDWTRNWVTTLLPHINPYLDSYANHKGFKEWVMHELWFQQYNTTGKHGWHVHGHNLTGVYYVDMPKNAPKTEIILSNGEVIQPDVKEGDILIFPSFVVHRAPINKSKETKTIVSFNMSFKYPIQQQLPK